MVKSRVTTWFIAFFVATAILVAGLLAWLVSTPQGLRSGAEALNWLLPQLQLTGLSGSLKGPLKISKIEYIQDGNHILIEDLFLDWEPSRLLSRHFTIKVLKAKKVSISEGKGGEEEGETNATDLGGIFDLPLPTEVIGLRVSQFSWKPYGDNPFFLSDIYSHFIIKNQRLRLKFLGLKFHDQPISVNVKGILDSSTPYLPLDLLATLEYRAQKEKKIHATLKAKGDLKRMEISLASKGMVTGQIECVLESMLSKINWDLNFDLEQLDTRAFTSSLAAKVSAKGHIIGGLDRFHIVLNGVLRESELPIEDFSAQGRYESGLFFLSSLNMHTLGGELSATGLITPGKTVSWDITTVAKQIDPSVKWPEWKGDLSGTISSKGKIGAGHPIHMDLVLHEISGTLNHKAVLAVGKASIEGERYRVSGLELSSGKSRLTLSGSLDSKVLDASCLLSSPDLSDVAPGLSGSLNIKARVNGPLNRPAIDLKTKASNVSVEGLSLKDLKAVLKTDFGIKGNLMARIEASGLNIGDLDLGKLKIGLDGTAEDNRLRAMVKGQEIEAKLSIKGRFEDIERYSGKIDRFEVSVKDQKWDMNTPAEFSVSRHAGFVQNLCLRGVNHNSKICLDFAKKRSDMKVKAAIGKLDLKALSFFMKDRLRATGFLTGGLNIENRATGQLRGDFHIEIQKGLQLTWQAGQGAQKAFVNGKLWGTLKEKGLRADLSLFMEKIGAVKARVELPGLRYPEDFKEQAVIASAKIALNQLGILGPFVPQIAQLQGQAHGDIMASGRMSRMKISGNASIKDLSFELPALGLTLSSPEMRFRSEDDGIGFIGSVQSGNGEVGIKGITKLAGQSLEVSASISGTDFLIADIPQIRAVVSPDIKLEVVGKDISATGKIIVPKADIVPQGFEKDAVEPSPDIVIKGAENRQDENKPKLRANITIVFGEHVSFDGFGLKGRLKGKIQVIEEPGQPPLGNGALYVKDATFNVFGSDLKLTRGRFLFSSTPIDNPEIELEAERQTDDVTAGFRIRGNLKKPVLTLFSDPSMAESEILSFLLGGGGGQGTRSKSGAAIAGAANIFASKIKQFLGIEDLRVKSGQRTEDISILIGTYLTPDLYVQFINDIGENMTTLKVKYSLTRRIEIQTETGDNPSADIFFKFER